MDQLPIKYYYFVIEGRGILGWRIRECVDEFPLFDVMNENPDKIITFWKEISGVEASNFLKTKT